MKIAIISPPWIPLPPIGYGGIEAVVYQLGEGLKRKGHEVIIYATGDSRVSTDLRYFYEDSLGRDTLLEKSHVYFSMNQVHYALKDMPKDVDIIHNHCEYVGMHLLANYKTPFVHTLHGAFYKDFDKHRDHPDYTTRALRETLHFFKNQPFISISNYQRQGMPDLNYIKTVFNGTNLTNLHFEENPEDQMCWLGRYSPLKGLNTAIEIAKKTNKKLVISAAIHDARLEKFDTEILSQIDNKILFNIGETKDNTAKNNLLAKSKLFLFPIQWEEPFGIVMTEAMACGTPVVAFARGSVPEVIKDGETGFLINPSNDDIRGDFIIKKTGIEGMCEAVEKIYSMPEKEYKQMRKTCREHVEQHFTVEKMVDRYIEAYQKVISNI